MYFAKVSHGFIIVSSLWQLSQFYDMSEARLAAVGFVCDLNSMAVASGALHPLMVISVSAFCVVAELQANLLSVFRSLIGSGIQFEKRYSVPSDVL